MSQHLNHPLSHSVSDHGITADLHFSVTSSSTLPTNWKSINKESSTQSWESKNADLLANVTIRKVDSSWIYQLTITNQKNSPLDIKYFTLGPKSVAWKNKLSTPHALYALHPRVTGINDYDAEEIQGVSPLAPLPANDWHALSERCPELPHLEGLVLTNDWHSPSFIEGPLSQNHAHQRKKVRWNGHSEIEFDITHQFLGIPARTLAPGETISESGFIQFRPDGDLNIALRDYLTALAASTGTRGNLNPLISERFFCTWNNYLYWEANEKEILPSVEKVKNSLPSVNWYLLDDGYMVSKGSTSIMDRNENGERLHTLEKELPWFHNCPGISFLFDDGDGVDYNKFPDGLNGYVQKVKARGMRPAIWIGFEASRHSPVATKHPDWFIDIGHESHLIPDLSVPEVRTQLRKAFKTIFHEWGFEAVKTDFITHLTENPNIQYRFHEKSGAEWRDWLFSTLREFVPEDGFITLGCWIAMGAPWHAPYLDSYRDSMDARDGNWNTVLSNVRWSVIPSLSGGAGQPIPDADTISVFKNMPQHAIQTWINYAHVGGMLVETGGDVLRWTDGDLTWVEKHLANDRSGGRVYFADQTFWSRDGLPCATYRAISENSYLFGIYNWSEQTTTISPDWIGPIEHCQTFTCCQTGQVYSKSELSNHHLPARSSTLFTTAVDIPLS